MKIIDISQEVFSCVVYPGDASPEARRVKSTAEGDLYNLTEFSMCAHNGTHIDAPFHFLGDGDTVEMIPLERTVGKCYVAAASERLSAEDAEKILTSARTAGEGCEKRILLRGDVVVTAETAEVFAEAGIYLLGVESQSVGEIGAPMQVHKILLSRGVVLLEGIRLSNVRDGKYLLSAAPLSLGGADGAPCRAFLIEMKL